GGGCVRGGACASGLLDAVRGAFWRPGGTAGAGRAGAAHSVSSVPGAGRARGPLPALTGGRSSGRLRLDQPVQLGRRERREINVVVEVGPEILLQKNRQLNHPRGLDEALVAQRDVRGQFGVTDPERAVQRGSELEQGHARVLSRLSCSAGRSGRAGSWRRPQRSAVSALPSSVPR